MSVSRSADSAHSVSTPSPTRLMRAMAGRLEKDGRWWSFERFMQEALYAPDGGYYSGDLPKFGRMPGGGSDFVTAPELSTLFGRALAVQVGQALASTETRTVCEFGAGTGALAEQLLHSLGEQVERYLIVDLSGALRRRQRQRLAAFGDRVQWLDEWPSALEAVVVGNEVLDAMPVTLLHWDGQAWWERGVGPDGSACGFAWSDRPSPLRPPVEGRVPSPQEDAQMRWPQRFAPGTVVEVHRQAEAFMTSLAGRLARGAAFFIDYGFPEHEYYHPQRTGGTLMCHRAHQADGDPLVDVGLKDITTHVNFTAMALRAQEAGLSVLGYTSQGRFLLNCGLADLMGGVGLAERADAARLVHEHEMGELFKVLGLAAGEGFDALGFAHGDRSHTL